MSIEAMRMALMALCLTNNDVIPDDIEKQREAAIQALRQAIERAEDAVLAHAGVRAWVGDKEITYLVTKVCIEHEAVKGLSMRCAADFCLEKLKEQA